MLEIILIVVISAGIGRIASSDGQSGIIWGVVTAVLCLATTQFIPLPMLRLLIAAVAAFVLYIAYKVVLKK